MIKAILAESTGPFKGSAFVDASTQAYQGLEPEGNIFVYIEGIILAVFSILGVVLLFLILYAGFLWMTAMGDPKKVTKATDILKESVIGLIILLSAYAISFTVIRTITAASG